MDSQDRYLWNKVALARIVKYCLEKPANKKVRVKMHVNRAALSKKRELVAVFGEYLAFPFTFKAKRYRVDVVMSLTWRGWALAQRTGDSLFDANKVDGSPDIVCLEDDTCFDAIEHAVAFKDKKVLIVEDLVDNDAVECLKEAVDWIQKTGGSVVGLGMIFKHRDVKNNDLKIVPEVVSLMRLEDVDSWNVIDCPACQAGIIETEKHEERKSFWVRIKRFLPRKKIKKKDKDETNKPK